MHELRAAGKTLAETAAALGLSQQLTGRFWRAASAEALLKTTRRLGAGPLEAAPAAAVGRRHHQDRGPAPGDHRAGLPRQRAHHLAWLALLKLAAPPKPPAPPGKQQVTGWMLTDPARLDGGEQDQLAAIFGRCPELQALAGHVTAFAKMLTRRAAATGLGRLARRRRRLPRPSPRSPTASAATTRPSATP